METWVSPFTNWLFPKQATQTAQTTQTQEDQGVATALDDRSHHQGSQESQAQAQAHTDTIPNTDHGKPHHEHQSSLHALRPTQTDPIKSEAQQPQPSQHSNVDHSKVIKKEPCNYRLPTTNRHTVPSGWFVFHLCRTYVRNTTTLNLHLCHLVQPIVRNCQRSHFRSNSLSTARTLCRNPAYAHTCPPPPVR